MIDAEQLEIIRSQASEIERLRFALYGCLVASKRTDPMDYAASLAFIHAESHQALYGDTAEFVAIERPLAGYYRKETEL